MSFTNPKFTQLNVEIGGLRLAYAFHTETSLSLSVQSAASQLARGWIDIHYPCAGHIKAQFRGALPEPHLNPVTIREILDSLRPLVNIAPEDTFEATFFKASNQIQIAQSTGEQSMTDRIETARNFSLPK
ncbi:MAG: hypothetical protein SFU53_06350 [Terrimicrobiaceae bacterium]|nr:hypothetical protein [Terrimicrobiaceae bacterium]